MAKTQLEAKFSQVRCHLKIPAINTNDNILDEPFCVQRKSRRANGVLVPRFEDVQQTSERPSPTGLISPF